MERCRDAAAAHNKSRRRHRSRDDAEDAGPGGEVWLTDINGWELAGSLPLVAGIVWFGVTPAPLLNLVKTSVDTVVQIAQLRMVP